MLQETETPKGFKRVVFLAKAEHIPQDWDFENVGSTGEVVGGGTPDTRLQEYWEGDIHWAVPSDITGLNSNFITSTERRITKKGLENSSAKLLPAGTVLITSRATVGECAINLVPLATNQGFQSLICNDKHHNLFMLYALKFNKSKLLRLAYGTTFLELSKNEIKKVKLAVPPKEEQQKIASILSKVDDLIQKTEEIIEHTRRLKKGLMQRALTKGIMNNETKDEKWYFGKIAIPKDWKIIDFQKVVERIKRGPSQQTNPNRNGPIYLTSDIITDDGFLRFRDLKYLDPRLIDDIEKYTVSPDDLIINCVNSFEKVGKVALFETYDEQVIIGFNNFAISTIRTIANPHFLKYLLLSSRMQNILKSISKPAINQVSFSSKDLLQLRIPLPPIGEQNVIASLLTNLDLYRIANEKYLDGVQYLKKGLMQKLLTGQIRVKV